MLPPEPPPCEYFVPLGFDVLTWIWPFAMGFMIVAGLGYLCMNMCETPDFEDSCFEDRRFGCFCMVLFVCLFFATAIPWYRIAENFDPTIQGSGEIQDGQTDRWTRMPVHALGHVCFGIFIGIVVLTCRSDDEKGCRQFWSGFAIFNYIAGIIVFCSSHPKGCVIARKYGVQGG